ncbi:hypothetical protein BGZ83_007696 [Gryganskiella cystojenkinii]|nr:hypothetical protein BGZ83_007696 [Gryganskiella cystojenkinii]
MTQLHRPPACIACTLQPTFLKQTAPAGIPTASRGKAYADINHPWTAPQLCFEKQLTRRQMTNKPIKKSKFLAFPHLASAALRGKTPVTSGKNKLRSIRDGIALSLTAQGLLPREKGIRVVPTIPAIPLASTIVAAMTVIVTAPTVLRQITPLPAVLAPSALDRTPQESVMHNSLRPNIFSKNVSRIEREIILPNVGSRIDETPQLVHCIDLLARATRTSSSSTSTSSSSPASFSTSLSSSTSPSPTSSPLTPPQVQWIQTMSTRTAEQGMICRLPVQMIDKFISRPNKDAEVIQEIVLIGPVLSKEHYRRLLNSFVSEFGSMTLLDVDVLHGLIQLVQDAPPKYLTADDMIQILRIIRKRLEDPAQQSEENTIPLMSALCKVLDIMEFNKVKDLDRVEEHRPLIAVIEASKASEDPLLKYLASYAFEALLCVPDDEPILHSLFRNAKDTVRGLVKVSNVVQLEFDGLTEGLPVLIEGGRGLFGHLKKALGVAPHAPWYKAIRQAEILTREGRFADLNTFVIKSKSCPHPMFQWGLCQLLGEIAVDQLWEEAPRGQAIEFLKFVFNSEMESSRHRDVRRWIVTILDHVGKLCTDETSSQIDRGAIKVQVSFIAGDLGKVAPSLAYPYPLINRLPLPPSSLILRDVHNTPPNLELYLDQLRLERQASYNKPLVYIQPMSKSNLQASSDKLDLLDDCVNDFLRGRAQVMLIMGDSGAGKSIFNERLENQLWETYSFGDAIPLFINLKNISKPDEDMIAQMLYHYNFSENQILELKKSHRFVLICDGYDECRKWTNLHTNNKLNKPNQWRAKMVITCRSQYLVPDYRCYFAPQCMVSGMSQSFLSDFYEEAVIVPFQPKQISAYIEQHTLSTEGNLQGHKHHHKSRNTASSSADQYMKQLSKMGHTMDLVKNPFLLKLVLDTLPQTVPATAVAFHDNNNDGNNDMTRAQLYDAFVAMHFEKEQNRLRDQQSRGKMDTESAKVFLEMEMEGDDFIFGGIDYSKRLSDCIFKNLDGVNSVDYVHQSDRKTWKVDFFGPETRSKLLRESSQVICHTSIQESSYAVVGGAGRARAQKSLTRTVRAYEFMHRSLLEYFFSCLVYDPREKPFFNELSHGPGLINGQVSPSSLSPLALHPFGRRELLTERSVLHFLVDRVQLDVDFENQLMRIVQKSKSDDQVAQAAANAITVLVRAGVRFTGDDLQGIQIPGADLTGGHFDSAKMNGANLTKVNFSRTWLRQVDFTDAKMENTFFGERPYFQVRHTRCCAASPKGKLLALGLSGRVHDENDDLMGGKIHIYNTSDGTCRYALSCPADGISALDFSRTDSFLVSGGISGTVTLVSFSPNGSLIASASDDRSVRIWSVKEGNCLLVLKHAVEVQSVAWSLDGRHILSCTNHGETVRISNAITGEAEGVLAQGLKHFSCVAFSLDGQFFLLGNDKSLYLLSALNGELIRTMSDHTDTITHTAFSRDCKRMASVGTDRTLRLYDVQTGSVICVWSSGMEVILGLVFLGDRQIATFSDEGTVRLWESDTGKSDEMAYLSGQLVSQGHTKAVHQVMYAPDGQSVLTASDDNTVRQWSTRDGKSIASHNLPDHLNRKDASVAISSDGQKLAVVQQDKRCRKMNFAGHEHHVRSLAWSRCSQWIASSDDDGTIQVWKVHADSKKDQRAVFDGASGSSKAVIQGAVGTVTSLAWSPVHSTLEFATGSLDNSVCLWKLMVENKSGQVGEETVRVVLVWAHVPERLVVSGAMITLAVGLGKMEQRMMRQRHAVDTSEDGHLGTKSGNRVAEDFDEWSEDEFENGDDAEGESEDEAPRRKKVFPGTESSGRVIRLKDSGVKVDLEP